MFLYRDMYYADKSDANENVAEVILAKNRHGSTGNATIGWYPQYTKFTSISDQPEG
jgi:replicative DNA helicase